MAGSGTVRGIAIAVLAAATGANARSEGPIVIETVARVRAEVVLSGADLPGSVGFLELQGGPNDAPSATIRLPWPEGGRLDLRAPHGPDREGGAVELEAVVTREGRVLARSTRRLSLGGASSTLWEVYRAQGRRIVLGVRTERLSRPALPAPPVVGPTVAFRVFVERVQGDATVLLETNDLQTFLEEPVGYSFRRGTGPDEESLTLRLVPLRIVGDVLQVAVDLEARLPGEDGPPALRKHQTLFASRGVETAVLATSGTPPSGYRFRVLAEF